MVFLIYELALSARMRRYLFLLTLLLLSACIVFPLYPFSTISNFEVTPYHIMFLLLVTVLAGLVGIKRVTLTKHYFFVCGECDLSFTNEKNLRNHYVVNHVKKEDDKD